MQVVDNYKCWNAFWYYSTWLAFDCINPKKFKDKQQEMAVHPFKLIILNNEG